jgi:3-carboxy-cis,cis-muconate cycloisomerase
MGKSLPRNNGYPMSVSVFDHPFLSGLLGDDETAEHFSVDADVTAMLRFEVVLAHSQAAEGVISQVAATAIENACKEFEPDMGKLRAETARDGVVVPGLIRQVRERIPDEHAPSFHRGPTSQDVIDTSLVMRLRQVSELIDRRLHGVIDTLDQLDRKFGGNQLVARTRMQRARDIHVRDRILAWRDPLIRHAQRLSEVDSRLTYLQMGGPTGTLNSHDGNWPSVKKRMGVALDLPVPTTSWHGQRERLVEFADCLAQISGSLGKAGQDLVLMAQNEIAEVELAASGTSSSMAHKNNPIGAEVLVTLARFSAVQISAMHHAMVHEQERSGAAWTLEWMVLPQICVATAAALSTGAGLIAGIRRMGRSSAE